MKRTARLLSLMNTQWQIHERGLVGLPPPLPPLFLDQTEAQRAKKNVFETPPPPSLRVWMTVPPSPLSEGLGPPLKLTVYKCY